ncbi:hypothetical protein OSB04_027373 [Centaurea solstitialis]|uniref:non-specific serine/threonine protein kinase n=1 Tax=Centaurea solstitialis TaxID=347529 RepID=A0AA38SX90_9ASTR|nr:hypothetical protein OSB04_027373 [Centaurea solstitialis]
MIWIYYYYFILITTSVASAKDTIFSNEIFKDGDFLVSAGGVFEFGFFSLANPSFRYLAIRYKNIPTADVVWVANRDVRLIDPTGMLKLNNNGTLQLLSVSNTLIWSSEPVANTSRNLVALQLLDSGNLVLKEDDEDGKRVIWQSFDHPGNTWLPGMKIGFKYAPNQLGIETNLTSWKSSDDPSQVLIQEYKSSFHQRIGFSNGVGFSGMTPGMSRLEPSNFCKFDFIWNDEAFYIIYTQVNDSVLTRMTLNEEGGFQLLVWINQTQSWGVYLTTFKDPCDTYGSCGAYGSCNINGKPQCRCLKGFEPKLHEEWSDNDWSSGCKDKNLMSSSDNGHTFKKFSNLKLPSRSGFFNLSMSLEECRNRWRKWLYNMVSELIDIRVAPPGDNSGQDIYIRMHNSGMMYLFAIVLTTIITTNISNWLKGDEKRKKKLVVILSTVSLVLLLGVALILYAWRTKRKSHLKGEAFVNEDQKHDVELPLFSLSKIVTATGNFSINNKLGQGGFGAVYKGVLDDGGEIAVKRLSKTSSQGLVEFQNEVICIAKLQHRNLVKLLGYCAQGDEKMLVYEYMPNKSLDFFLFDKDNSLLLDWSQRYHIINGIARGLLYLQQDSRLRIIHRDLKASNILLDSDMNPKISDFGLARMFEGYETEANTNKVVGTLGYISPEYAAGGVFSVKSDVYSYGVLVLEIVSGKKNRGFFHQDQHDTLLGHGVLDDGVEIAVKRLSKTSSQGLVEFQNEVICIAKLQHRNLVKLLGYCIQGEEKMLVYEYMPNKSLDFFLFDKDNSLLLDWPQRYHIINGIARGLLYLHEDSRLRIIHRDLKASNILLDSNMNPKISDFGLARMFEEYETEVNTNKVVGTLGYISPEYAAGGVFSVKSDVFSFGVLVLEIVSGKKNRGFFHQDQHDTLLGHAWRLYKEDKLLELVDAALEDLWNVSEVLQSINVGLSCVQQHPEDRPSMSSVIHMLRGERALPPPKQPRFFSDETEPEVESTTLLIPKVSVSINEVTLTKIGAR